MAARLIRRWRHRVVHCGPLWARYAQRLQSNQSDLWPGESGFFRYLAIYKLGGVYLDIKSTATTPLDDVLSPDDEYLLSHWSNREGHPYKGWGRHHPRHGFDEEYQQWHIVAAAHHPFLEAVIERVKKNIDAYDPLLHGVGKRGVLQVTGPIAYTLAIQSVRQSGRFRLVDIEELERAAVLRNQNSQIGGVLIQNVHRGEAGAHDTSLL